MIRILAVDDHPMLREGLAAILANEPDMELVGEAADGEEALERFRSLRPDVTLMDLQMPKMGGVEAITAIRQEAPGARIIVLTTYTGDVQALRALRAGAAGYLLKSSVRKELLDTIRAIHAGRRYVPPGLAQEIAIHSAEEPLSARELQVLNLVAQGQANKQIACRLGVSDETVKAHMKNIFVKLEVGDRTGAVMVSVRRGILDT